MPRNPDNPIMNGIKERITRFLLGGLINTNDKCYINIIGEVNLEDAVILRNQLTDWINAKRHQAKRSQSRNNS